MKPKLVLCLSLWLWGSPGNRQRLLEAGLASSRPKIRFLFMTEPGLHQQLIFPHIRAETTRAVKSAGKTPKIAAEEPKPVPK